MTDKGVALDWDSEIENVEDTEFKIVPKGTYQFTVEKLEKEFYAGSEKMAPCPRAVLRLSVTDDSGSWIGNVFERIFLNTKSAFKIAQFYRCIGLPVSDDGKFKPAWDSVEDKSGVAEIGIREYNGKEYNEVVKFLKPDAEDNPYEM